MIKDFVSAARSLTKNPLGVIGLFIVLVYGFACLVVGLGGESLKPSEKLPIVWFIVVFPLIILCAFYRLVTKHHKKLYAPSDFTDERLFFSTQDEEMRKKRLEEEASNIQTMEVDTVLTEEVLPSQQRPLSEIKSRYSEAERLAFLAIEEKLGQSIQKYVSVQVDGRSEEFDGLLRTQDTTHLIEIKYFSRPNFKRDFLQAALYRASSFLWDELFDDKNKRDNVVFWFVIIMDFPEEDAGHFKENIQKIISGPLFSVKFLFFHFGELERKYKKEGANHANPADAKKRRG